MTKLWIVIQCEIWVWALPNNLQITMNTPECPPNDIEWHEGYCFRKSVEQLFPWASAPMTNDHPAINQSLGKVSMPRLCLESVVAPRHWHPSQLQVLCQFFHCQRATKVCVLSTGSCKVKSMSCTGGSTWDSRSLSLSLHSRPQQRVKHTNGRVVTRKVLASRYYSIRTIMLNSWIMSREAILSDAAPHASTNKTILSNWSFDSQPPLGLILKSSTRLSTMMIFSMPSSSKFQGT